MNKVTKYLAIGLTIAIVVALAICYFVWSLHSVHRLVWFVIAALICLCIGHYLSAPDYAEYNNPKGKTDYEKVGFRQMTKWEQIGVVVRTVVGSVIIGALVWTIGYGVSCVLDLNLYGLNQDYWEMYLLYGVGLIVAIVLVVCIIYKIWMFCSDLIYNRSHARKTTKSVLAKLFAIIFSLAIAGAILYFLLPLAMKF